MHLIIFWCTHVREKDIKSSERTQTELIRKEEKRGNLMLIKPNCNTFETNPTERSPCLED